MKLKRILKKFKRLKKAKKNIIDQKVKILKIQNVEKANFFDENSSYSKKKIKNAKNNVKILDFGKVSKKIQTVQKMERKNIEYSR